ncbi:MAG: PAS domain-containing protein [Bacteroidetes bacterium]|nr:PAS domain-containing protein [Bacteroidota bacterium]
MKSKAPKSAENISSKLRENESPIIAIGASAGGLEALEQFFGNMPIDSGLVFVVIQHLDPDHVGIMPELLQRITNMRVFQACDNMKVKPNSVYVIPPNKSMSILKGNLHLFAPVESRGLRLPIDFFFRSLALDKGEKSIGIILSGMGSDGSLGLKAIKEKNGTVLVQSPKSAKFDGMPRSAIEAVIADIVAPAEDLPKRLISFLKFVPKDDFNQEPDEKENSNISKIIILLRQQSGHDFSLYKKNTLFRRIERRKGIHQIDKINNYVRYLQENPKEIDILFQELLIGVTNFFRDTIVWERLKQEILPKMLSELPNGYILRAWIPACSTGEEAYSLAIVFQEVISKLKKPKNLTLQIFATDIDNDAIEKARKGIFSVNIASDVSADRLSHFFTQEPEGFKISAYIREMVVFAPQNVIKDPPFTKLDFLSCRNMLIYMEHELQKKLMALFNYSLNPGGLLVLGTAETLGTNSEGFMELDTRLKIYQRTASHVMPELIDFPSSFSRSKKSLPNIKATPQNPENIQSLTDQFLLQKFSPASVLINDRGDIIYITGRTGKYLEPTAGKANWNIYSMAREGLRESLPIAIRKAMKNFEPVVLKNIKIGTNGGTQFVDLTVQKIESPNDIRGLLIIVFSDVPAIIGLDPTGKKPRNISSKGRQKELENDLQRSYEDLQSTREEMQTSQEELKSTNEELQSSNEELQSTNEELTTSKEEMQSLNEELQTVNFELQSKVTDFVQANNDMKNLLNSTEIATLFLDKELNIRRFTDSLVHLFKLRGTDIGRPFTDLVTDLEYPNIETDAKQVLKTLSSIETAISTKNNKWFTIRIMPYRTMDDRIDGLVLTFIDITVVKKLELEIKKANDLMVISETHYRRLFESAQHGILSLDAETGMITDVNEYLTKLLGFSKEEFFQKKIWEIGTFKDVVANKNKFLELQKKEIIHLENLNLETSNGKKIMVDFNANVYSVSNIKVIQCKIREIEVVNQKEKTSSPKKKS